MHTAGSRVLLGLLVLLSALVLAVPGPSGTAHAEELVVGVKPAPPFVLVEEGQEPRGFSVDLAREIAQRMDPPRTVRFVVHPDLKSHLAAVAAGEVQMGIAATSITAERRQRLEFSSAFFTDFLDIAMHESAGEASLWTAVRDSGVPNVLLGLALFVVITAHIVWLVERGRGGLDRGYLAGVTQGVWWTIVTMSTVGYGDIVPKTGIGRVIGVVVIFAGIVVFGVAVASLTAAATAQRLETGVRSVEDLRGQRVLAIPGSIAERELRKKGVPHEPVESTRAALEAIRADRADAFVQDRSQLLYAKQRDGAGWLLVDRPFNEQNYAVAFPIDSPIQRQVDIALLQLKEGEDSPRARLESRWFRDR